MAEPDGKYITEWAASRFACRTCLGRVQSRIWQAAGEQYERMFLRCDDCGREWYINGAPPEEVLDLR